MWPEVAEERSSAASAGHLQAHPTHRRAICGSSVAGIVVFFRAQRHSVRATERFGHVDGGLPFGRADGLDHVRIDHQPMAVFHQHMTRKTELRRCLLALPVQQRRFVGLRLVRVATALLATEVDPAVSTTTPGWLVFVLR